LPRLLRQRHGDVRVGQLAVIGGVEAGIGQVAEDELLGSGKEKGQQRQQPDRQPNAKPGQIAPGAPAAPRLAQQDRRGERCGQQHVGQARGCRQPHQQPRADDPTGAAAPAQQPSHDQDRGDHAQQHRQVLVPGAAAGMEETGRADQQQHRGHAGHQPHPHGEVAQPAERRGHDQRQHQPTCGHRKQSRTQQQIIGCLKERSIDYAEQRHVKIGKIPIGEQPLARQEHAAGHELVLVVVQPAAQVDARHQ
jgi:hypothetical protein